MLRPLSARLAGRDARIGVLVGQDRFGLGDRPLVRIHAADDTPLSAVRFCVHVATRTFGSRVDHCLCTPAGVDAAQAREMLAWALRPVEWREGFPPEIRPNAQELILEVDEMRQGLAGLRFPEPARGPVARFRWLGGAAQWGVPGWSVDESFVRALVRIATPMAGRSVLELGTSRGRLAATLAAMGCVTTTVDHEDRGAARNLAGLPVRVVRADAARFLEESADRHDLVVVDLHGNTVEDWQRLEGPLLRRLTPAGTLMLNNARLDEMPPWREETGVRWFLGRLGPEWTVGHSRLGAPGFAVARRRAAPSRTERSRP